MDARDFLRLPLFFDADNQKGKQTVQYIIVESFCHSTIPKTGEKSFFRIISLIVYVFQLDGFAFSLFCASGRVQMEDSTSRSYFFVLAE
jgi:hypothetical protein